MRKSFKHLASLLLIPAIQWYLKKERSYKYEEVTVRVWPGVFHPGFFSSTKFILGYLKQQNLAQQSLLELGCGSGLISVYTARLGAVVTASDLSNTALENTKWNAAANGVGITPVFSDLFENLPGQRFDWIIINPPYYARTPKNDAERAWYCGENFEYFQKLFRSLGHYIHHTTHVIMVLTKGCDIIKITEMAKASGFRFQLISEKNVLFDEKDFLYRIQPVSSSE